MSIINNLDVINNIEHFNNQQNNISELPKMQIHNTEFVNFPAVTPPGVGTLLLGLRSSPTRNSVTRTLMHLKILDLAPPGTNSWICHYL